MKSYELFISGIAHWVFSGYKRQRTMGELDLQEAKLRTERGLLHCLSSFSALKKQKTKNTCLVIYKEAKLDFSHSWRKWTARHLHHPMVEGEGQDRTHRRQRKRAGSILEFNRMSVAI